MFPPQVPGEQEAEGLERLLPGGERVNMNKNNCFYEIKTNYYSL